MKIIPDETSGIIENLLASFMFFSPNFLMLFPFFSDKIHLFMVYNYFVMFIIISTMSHFRFSRQLIDTGKIKKITPSDAKILREL